MHSQMGAGEVEFRGWTSIRGQRMISLGQYGLAGEGGHDDVHRPFGHAGLKGLAPHD